MFKFAKQAILNDSHIHVLWYYMWYSKILQRISWYYHILGQVFQVLSCTALISLCSNLTVLHSLRVLLREGWGQTAPLALTAPCVQGRPLLLGAVLLSSIWPLGGAFPILYRLRHILGLLHLENYG